MEKIDLQIIHGAVDKIAADAGVNPAAIHDIVGLAKKRGHFFMQARRPWRMPSWGDSEKTCAFLPLMNDLSGQKGIILFLPSQEDRQ